MSLVTLGQGIPFFQGGDDLLRSKDMDQNSYDSGDWFNKIDWSGQTAQLGHRPAHRQPEPGPVAHHDPAARQSALTRRCPPNIAYTRRLSRNCSRSATAPSLFRMATLAEVQKNLTFLNTGPSQTPGLIVMKLDANGGNYGRYKHIVAVFNATDAQVSFQNSALVGLGLHLHPVQQHSADSTVGQSSFNAQTGTLVVPALTTTVFVTEKP